MLLIKLSIYLSSLFSIFISFLSAGVIRPLNRAATASFWSQKIRCGRERDREGGGEGGTRERAREGDGEREGGREAGREREGERGREGGREREGGK